MVFLILTLEGYHSAQGELKGERISLWLNPGLLDMTEQQKLINAGLIVQELPQQYDAEDEKSVLAALTYVEQFSGEADIMVEYPE